MRSLLLGVLSDLCGSEQLSSLTLTISLFPLQQNQINSVYAILQQNMLKIRFWGLFTFLKPKNIVPFVASVIMFTAVNTGYREYYTW
jgi:hypothetical protein